MPIRDLTGHRFGRLVGVEYAGGGRWRCKCDCGRTVDVITSNLNKGNTASCGCRLTESRIKHGMSGTKVHAVWKSMVFRCHNPKDRSFHNYGGRGITVCTEWRESFSQFIADMGLRPDGFDIDRIDNNKGYGPDNCRWVSRKRNLNNRRNNRRIQFNGQSRTIAQWADALGINYRTLNNRINRGWPIERALTEGAKASFTIPKT